MSNENEELARLLGLSAKIDFTKPSNFVKLLELFNNNNLSLFFTGVKETVAHLLVKSSELGEPRFSEIKQQAQQTQ